MENYQWRVEGLTSRLELEILIIVFQEINGQITNSSGYLGKISDRSKELYFKNLTVGQYLHQQIKTNSHTRLKEQVFYRQDYLDEFERLWETQSKFHSEHTSTLKTEIRDVVIFYQRRLKSQKRLINVCEFEGREIIIEKNGKSIPKNIGPKVYPKSAPLFQEVKIWQNLNDLEFKNIVTKEQFRPNLELKEDLFQKLNIREKLNTTSILKTAGLNARDGWNINFKNGLDGNHTIHKLYQGFQQIVEHSGHEIEWSKLQTQEIVQIINEVFGTLGINTDILHLNTDLEGHIYLSSSLSILAFTLLL